MSPAAYEAHRRSLEAATKYDDDRALEREAEKIRALVARLEAAAAVGSKDAKRRLHRLWLNYLGGVTEKCAGEALRRLDAELTRKQ